MKILHVIHSVNPAGGGPVEGIKQLAEVQQSLDHQITVVSLDDPHAAWVKDFPFPIYPAGPSLWNYGYSPRLIPWLAKHHTEYDALIVNGLWQFNSFATWKVLRHSKVPYFVFTHGMLDPWFKHRYPLKHLKKWLYWPWAEYRALRDAAAVLFTSEEERLKASKSFWLYRAREIVVHYGTRGHTGNACLQKKLFLDAYPHLAGKRVLLYLGRIHEKKGCDLLIEAFFRLLSKYQGRTDAPHLVFAGPDTDSFAKKLKQTINDYGIGKHVTWTGMLSGDWKWGAFHSAEAFVLPSHQENFGISVAEALSCSLPVLISNKVNTWREIQKEEAGLVENDDLEGTERLLEKWLNLESDKRHLFRANARNCFLQHFNIQKAAANLTEVLKNHLPLSQG